MTVRSTTSLLVVITLLGACASTPEQPSPTWKRSVVLRVGAKLNGCAIGDLDPTIDGPEIAAVASTGQVFVMRREPIGWIATEVAQLPGEPIQCAIGDADPSRPGNELAIVGMQDGPEASDAPGRASIAFRDEDGEWHCETVHDDPKLLHAVCVADSGVVAAGFSNRAFRVVRSGDGWQVEAEVALPGAAKNALAARGGIVFACTDGSVVVWRSGDHLDLVDAREAGRARLGAHGGDLVVADDDGTLSLLRPGGGAERVFQDEAKLRGAVIADIDVATPGLELATAGYGQQVVLLRKTGGTWTSQVLSIERDRVHHLAGADVEPAAGVELVVACFTGELVLLRRE